MLEERSEFSVALTLGCGMQEVAVVELTSKRRKPPEAKLLVVDVFRGATFSGPGLL